MCMLVRMHFIQKETHSHKQYDEATHYNSKYAKAENEMELSGNNFVEVTPGSPFLHCTVMFWVMLKH